MDTSRELNFSEYDQVELRNKKFRISRPFTVEGHHHHRNTTRNSGWENQAETQQRSINSIISRSKSLYSKPPEPKAERVKANIGPKNGNMVLQLVLPSSSQNSNHLESNYLTNSSIDEILGNGGSKRRSVGSQPDGYSTNGSYVNPGFNNDLGEYSRSFVLESIPQSNLSYSSSEIKPTSPEEKKRNFRKHLTNILSSMYALFIVTLGIVVYISDIILKNTPIAETFSLYLVIVGLIFVLYLIIDIKLYMNKRNHHNNLLENNVTEDIEMKESPTGDYHLNITLPEAARFVKELDHHYCFSKDRHSANFYLKVGAAGFCVGHLIHSGLLLGYQILFLTSDGDAFYSCTTMISLVLNVVYPIYSFFLLYFIFKYSNIIINRHLAVVRFGLMHCISSSLCFWVWTIMRETIESLSNHEVEEEEEAAKDSKISEIAFFTGQPIALPLTSYNKRGAKLLTDYLNKSVRHFAMACQGDEGLSIIYRNYSPYLYPFSVEYSILVVGVLFVIWQSIGKCKEKEEMLTSQSRQCDSREGNGDNLESNVVVHADCHSANKGLFGGIVIMVLTVVSIILFFIAINDVRYKNIAIFINIITSIVIILLMTITGILSYRQITKLDVNTEHNSILDDLLLFICIPAFFLNGIVSIIPAILQKSGLSITLIILEVTQVLVQTPLIIDGLRRSSNSKELRREKPGRELLTFLIVANVAMWITQTFEVKSHGLQDHRYEFYGEELWTIIGHMCIPLMMFYRFHSSVCIVDIWKYAYEPANH